MYRIGFDTSGAFEENSSLGYYGKNLIHSMADYYSHDHYLLYTTQNKKNPLPSFTSSKNISIRTPNGLSSIFENRWWNSGLQAQIEKDKTDLFHGLSSRLPGGKIKIPMVVTIHDTLFMRFPEYYSLLQRHIRQKRVTNACKRANKIVAVSIQCADDLIKYLDVDPNKIEVVYQSCARGFCETVSAEELKKIKEKYSLPQKYILAIDISGKRGNVENIEKSMDLLSQDIHLVILTDQTHKSAQTNKPRIHFLKGFNPNDAPAIFKNSLMVVYAPYFDYSAVTVLEAMSTGTPIVTAGHSAMTEIGGDAALFVNPADTRDIAQKINLLLSSPTLYEEMKGKGLEQAARFKEEDSAAQIREIYQKLLK